MLVEGCRYPVVKSEGACKKDTIVIKKNLYSHNFCHTFSVAVAPVLAKSCSSNSLNNLTTFKMMSIKIVSKGGSRKQTTGVTLHQRETVHGTGKVFKEPWFPCKEQNYSTM